MSKTKIGGEEDAIDFINSATQCIRKYGAVAALVGAAFATYGRLVDKITNLETMRREDRKDFEQFRGTYDAFHAVGADGYTSPQLRFALDKHFEINNTRIRAEITERLRLADEATKLYFRLVFQLNPSLSKPSE